MTILPFFIKLEFSRVLQVGAVKIVKTLMEIMEQVVALKQVVLSMMVMLIKLIMACRGHKEMKIIMPHKIQIMDID